MLKTLINKYSKMPSMEFVVDSDYANYLEGLQKDTLKMAYLELRLSEPTLKQKEIAERLGITPKTICEWQRDSQFNRTITELFEQNYSLQRSEIINMVYQKALEGDYKAIEVFLKYTS